MAQITAGTHLYIGTASFSDETGKWTFSDYKELFGVLSTPELGAEPNKIDITDLGCLKYKKYMNGLQDQDSISFEMLFDNSSDTAPFRLLTAAEAAGGVHGFKLELPDTLGANGTTFEWAGEVSVKMNAINPDEALKFTLTTGLQSEFIVTNAA